MSQRRYLPYRDDEFIRGKVPLTKEKIRILTTMSLGIEPDDQIVDIGAGTGGLSLEAARLAYNGKVYAVERNEKAWELIEANMKHFGVKNIKLLRGSAPEVLWPIGQVDKVIIGGSGKAMAGILDWVKEHLNEEGRIVANFISLENAYEALALMKERFEDVAISQVAINEGAEIGGLTLLKANNPIFILTAKQKAVEHDA